MILFSLERLSSLPTDVAWQRLTDWHRHADVVPLTRVTVRTPPPTAEGTVFVARSGVGPLAFDDPMEVVVWQPPESGRAGRCRLVKHGSLVRGWAEIEVHPYAGGGRGGGQGDDSGHAAALAASRVLWREELRVHRLPGLCDPPLGWLSRRMFGRAVDGLLRETPSGR
ncbi:SRPBCC family protein [Streptomyces heilongjiangensis]|uniref:SRPBCC family protein n=1 Tax=Streptomyces heilongjiangensis TaxID=945052 RepID=A0ABW1BEX0_9ACTN|nr:SRPBCC family protein [Streptomyces heilongjiangensis]MDC2951884.1 SRPBCC family protein [Streptomyces heilongjiangensis]